MQPVDLNQVLLATSATCTLDDVKQLLSFSLQQETILQVVKSSRRFDLLLEFLPFIRFDQPIVEELEKMLAQAIVDDDQEVIAQIEQCTKNQLSLKKIAFHLGRLAIPSTDTSRHVAYEEYLEGVISIDNLELFLTLDISNYNPGLLRRNVAGYSAMRILNYLLDLDPVHYNCITAAYDLFKKDVINLIFEKYPDRQALLDELNTSLYEGIRYGFVNPDEFIKPTRWLLTEGFLVLSEEDLQKIRAIDPTFYRALQADV